MLGNFYSDNTGYNAKQLNIQSGTMGESVAFESFKFGTYKVSSDDEDTVSIDTKIPVGGFIVQVYRAGILVNGYSVSASNTIITIATNENETDCVLRSGDIINWFAFV